MVEARSEKEWEEPDTVSNLHNLTTAPTNLISLFFLVDVDILHKIRFQPTKRKGSLYTSIVSYKVTTTPKAMTFYFTNLFEGKNKELSDNLHTVLNENWKEVYDDVRPQYDQAYSLIFSSYADRIFSKVPLNQIFPK